MKRKKLVTLLFTSFASACMALTGCGTEEVVSEEPTISEQSSNEEEMTEEIFEEVATEEISEEVENVEKPSVEANLDIVIEASPELQASKEEMMPLGVETTMDFGTITRLGDNKDYPNALEDYEICFEGQLFQISLPKDMCAEFEWDFDYNSLKIYNADKSKQFFVFQINQYIPIESKNVQSTTEEMNSVITMLGGTPIDNSTVTYLENDNVMSQKINANFGDYEGELLVYQEYQGEAYEIVNEENTTSMVIDTSNFFMFYGDANKTNADEISAYVVESFKPIN